VCCVCVFEYVCVCVLQATVVEAKSCRVCLGHVTHP